MVVASSWDLQGTGARLGNVFGSLRRRFATDLDKSGARLSDIAHLGGWNGTQTLLQCYIQPDRETMRQALQKRSDIRSATA